MKNNVHKPKIIVGECRHPKHSNRHSDRTGNEQGFSSPSVHGLDRHNGKHDIDKPHDDGLEHRSIFPRAQAFKDARSIVQSDIDPDKLLEHGKQNPDDHNRFSVGKQMAGRFFLAQRKLDILQNFFCFSLEPLIFSKMLNAR